MAGRIACLLTMVLGFGLGVYSWAGQSEPDIRFEETAYDFGEVREGEEVTHLFRFKNLGGKELDVTSARACCGCRALLTSGKVTPSGGEGEVEVTFYSRGKEGRQARTIRVCSNDPDEPIVTLKLTGVVKPVVSVSPRGAFFGEVPRGEERTEELEILQVGEEDLRSLRVESRTEFLSTEVSEIREKERKGFKVVVTLSPDTPVGELREILEIHTNLEGHGPIVVPVRAKIPGDISVVPDRLFLMVSKGVRISRKVLISSRSEKKFDILKVQSDLEFVSVRASQVEQGRSYEITLNLKIDDMNAVRDGEIEISTNDPDQPVIKVPIYFDKARGEPE